MTDAGEWQILTVAPVPPQAKHARIAADPSGLPVVGYFEAQTASVGMGRNGVVPFTTL